MTTKLHKATRFKYYRLAYRAYTNTLTDDDIKVYCRYNETMDAINPLLTEDGFCRIFNWFGINTKYNVNVFRDISTLFPELEKRAIFPGKTYFWAMGDNGKRLAVLKDILNIK